MRDLLKAVGSSLLVDPKLDLLQLARQFQSLTSGKINFATVPNNGPQLIYPDGVETSIIEVNRAAMPAFIAQIEGKADQDYAKAKAADPVVGDRRRAQRRRRPAAGLAQRHRAETVRISHQQRRLDLHDPAHDDRVPAGQAGPGQGAGRRRAAR